MLEEAKDPSQKLLGELGDLYTSQVRAREIHGSRSKRSALFINAAQSNEM
jgi:hypothetical protein